MKPIMMKLNQQYCILHFDYFVKVTPTDYTEGSSCILKMVGQYYPQDIWYLDFCVELSFSVIFPDSMLPQIFACIDFL